MPAELAFSVSAYRLRTLTPWPALDRGAPIRQVETSIHDITKALIRERYIHFREKNHFRNPHDRLLRASSRPTMAR
jgi:hypothetical protein